MNLDLPRQQFGLYSIPFRNLGSATMPAYGVGLVTSSNVDDGGLFLPSVVESTSSDVVGFIVNGPVAVPSGGYGEGYWGVGPVLCLYDTADGSPAVGDTWGIKSGGTAFTLNKGYHGFTCVSAAVAGSGSEARGFFMPTWYTRPAIVGHLYRSGVTITNADSATQIIELNSAGDGNGEWPSSTLSNCIDIDTSTGRMTVRRSGCWRIHANWSSVSSNRFSAPYQSKVNRCGVKLYKNGSLVTGALQDYYHFALANADTSPTSGTAMPVPAALNHTMYLATGDIIDMRVTISEVTADSGTTTEGYVTFSNFHFIAEFLGAQQWRNDY